MFTLYDRNGEHPADGLNRCSEILDFCSESAICMMDHPEELSEKGIGGLCWLLMLLSSTLSEMRAEVENCDRSCFPSLGRGLKADPDKDAGKILPTDTEIKPAYSIGRLADEITKLVEEITNEGEMAIDPRRRKALVEIIRAEIKKHRPKGQKSS